LTVIAGISTSACGYAGGAPKKSAATRREEIRRYNLELEQRYNDLTLRLVNVERGVDAAFKLYESAHASNQERFFTGIVCPT